MIKMYSRTISYVLAPIISAFLFVTIITVNPTTVTGDLNTKEIITANAVLPVVTSSVPETLTPASPPTSSASASTPVTPKSTPAKTNTPPTTLVKKEQTQPSRSSSTSTGTRTAAPTSTPTKAPTSTPQTSSQSGKASSIIATSKQYIGVNYLYGGTTPAGFDCSGFVQYVFAKNGVTLPRVSRDQYRVGTSVSFNNLRPGDLVFFSFANNGVVDHVGIHVGNGQFINASSSKGVTIYTLGPYWQSIYVGAKRVI